MRVLSKAKLVDFWNVPPRARSPQEDWFDFASAEEWDNFNEVKLTFPHTDRYGKYVIFDVGGIEYRLIVAIHYNRRKVYVRHVLTHAEYDLGRWKNVLRWHGKRAALSLGRFTEMAGTGTSN